MAGTKPDGTRVRQNYSDKSEALQEIADLEMEAAGTPERIRVIGAKLRRTLKRSVPLPPVAIPWLKRYPFEGLPVGWNYKQKVLKAATGATRWVPDRDAIDACTLLDEAGIQSYTSFIHDPPEETDEDREQTFELVEQLCKLPTNRQFHHFYMPFPSTEIYNKLIETAALNMDSWKQEDWANSSTYGSQIWPGQPPVRKYVTRRLKGLKENFPHIFKLQELPEEPAESSQPSRSIAGICN